MEITPLSIEGAFLFTPKIHGDDRGAFLEWFRADRLTEAVGHDLTLAQANLSVSSKGTMRGIHVADVPPGQAKFVTCVTGSIFDVVVDLRVGSPTFGRWEGVQLDQTTRRGVYVAEGLGHGFLALKDQTTVAYLCSTPYAPDREHEVNPLDPTLAINWPDVGISPLLSAKDSDAPTLTEAEERGLLPTYAAYQDWTRSLRHESAG